MKPLVCECERPLLELDTERVVTCANCGKVIATRGEAAAVAVATKALASGIRLDGPTLNALADRVAERVEVQVIEPRALNKTQAAQYLGVSDETFERYILPELRVIRLGRRRLVPVLELDGWLDENAELTIAEGA